MAGAFDGRVAPPVVATRRNGTAVPRVCDGDEIFFREFKLQTPHIIERAFQLAPSYSSVEEIRKALRHEGYSNIDAHLSGASIRADLKKRFAQQPQG
jgi:hypothetical protein